MYNPETKMSIIPYSFDYILTALLRVMGNWMCGKKCFYAIPSGLCPYEQAISKALVPPAQVLRPTKAK